MAQGNKGFADRLAGGGNDGVAKRLPPRTGILGSRENRLAELATGNAVSRIHELVDPARCRIWDGHNRDYAALGEQNCADLIESFRAQGRQEVPAIVRRIAADPSFAYEVICGARRHWTVSWLRANNHPEFKFLVEPRELTDEEAFRLADLENRSRRDLSDFERAMDYAKAVERYYSGSQQRMAERLEVSKSWLSRYLELAKLPAEVMAAFGSPHVVGISHSATLAPLLRVAEKRDRVLDEVTGLAAEQARLSTQGQPFLPPAAVLHRLVRAAQGAGARGPKHREHVVRGADGTVLARASRNARGGGLAITIPNPAKQERLSIIAAVSEVLDVLAGKPGGATTGDR